MIVYLKELVVVRVITTPEGVKGVFVLDYI